MENVIKGLALLKDHSEKDIAKMEQAALLHSRHSNIHFKVLGLDGTSVAIRVTQEKSGNENHFNSKRLIEIVHETFDRFFPGRKIMAHAVPYVPSPVEQVNTGWIKQKMLKTGTTLKVISRETGVEYSSLSGAINETGRTLSQAMRAMFYYYFLSKKK